MAVDSRVVRGLGLYPGDSCYDPNRSWLWPHWMDNLTEQACVAGQNLTPLTLPPPIPPGVPATPATPTGAVTPEQAAAIIAQRDTESVAANRSQLEEYFRNLAVELAAGTPPPAPEPCKWYQAENSDGVCKTGGTLLWGLILGGGVLAIVVAAKR